MTSAARKRHNGQVAQALIRLKKASQVVAALIDNEIDPPWVDSQELENAAIAYGRLLNAGPGDDA